MQLALKNPLDWARQAGYEVLPTDAGYKQGLQLVHSAYPAFNLGSMKVASAAYKRPFFIRATDAKLIIINHGRNGNSHDYRYFIASRNNDLLTDDHFHNPFWLKFFSCFEFLDAQSVRLKLDEGAALQRLDDPSAQLFVGGQSHFGHWMVDHLPIAVFSHDTKVLPPQTRLLVSKLNAFQRETLEACGIESVVSQVDVGSRYLTVLTIPELYVLCDLSVCRAYELLRNVLRVQSPETSRDATQAPRRIYFERGTIRGMNRLVNERQVIEFLKKKEFEIVRPHDFNLRQKAQHFGQCDLFVCPPASAYFNFYFFSHARAHLIYCIHETALYNETTAVLGGSYYQCHDLHRTTLLPAIQNTALDKSWPQYDAECYVDIELLERAIDAQSS